MEALDVSMIAFNKPLCDAGQLQAFLISHNK